MEDNNPLPENLRISTHTATCKINSNINLKVLAENLELNKNIIYIEYGNSVRKGVNSKQLSVKKMNKKKIFFNQITMIIQPEIGFKNNVKLFNNGSISMTGLKALDHGKKSVNIILDLIKNLSDNEGNYVLDNNDCKIIDYNIVLINSDFYIGYEIKRDELHKILINKYKIFSSFEPCIYPGVNSKFYWNEDYKDHEFCGRCYCKKSCSGKGNARGDGNCKTITIAAFQSGSIIITGARNIEQINIAYNFINNIFTKHMKELKKVNPSFLEVDDTPTPVKEQKNIIYLKRSIIQNMPTNSQVALNEQQNKI